MQSHRNNIGLLRLVFASLVVVGHAPELLDRSRAREPLTMLFHTLSLGELSVDAFFLLSGYLIAESMMRTRAFTTYLTRRVLRIYPAFIVASLVSVFGLGTLMGAAPWHMLPGALLRMVLLHAPMHYAGSVPRLPALNGAMWTIAYEFRCYLLIAALYATGLLARRSAILSVAAALLLCDVALTYPSVASLLPVVDNQGLASMLAGLPAPTIRLTAIFLIGTCFHLFRTEIGRHLNGMAALACAATATALLYRNPHFAEAGLVTFGAMALFWVALEARLGSLQHVNDEWDISYGVYLYGWPVTTYLIWRQPAMPLWMLTIGSLGLALGFGTASWWGIERWAKDWGRARSSSARSPGNVIREPAA